MRRFLLQLLLLTLAGVSADAQVFAVYFKDEKAASKYKANLCELGGVPCVIGELKEGISWNATLRTTSFVPNQRFELWVADPGNPLKVPYELLEDGTMKVKIKKGVLGVQGAHVERVVPLIEQQSLYGMAREYEERLAQIEEFRAWRDEAEQGDKNWFDRHRQLMSRYDRLHSWLAGTAYPKAAEKLEKEIAKEIKKAKVEAVAERLAKAKAAIHKPETPEDLVAASESITGGKVVFHVQESYHIRITYMEEIGHERVRALLEFGEELIDGFRVDCVDPYLSDDYEDKIPDRLFIEFWFGPEEKEQHKRFFTEYYRQDWGDRIEERLESGGQRAWRGMAPEHLNYWRMQEGRDLEGIVAHSVGHALAEAHYNLHVPNMQQDWIGEAVGYFVSLEYLGRNSVTCKAFAEPGKYVHQKGKEGEKSMMLGLRDFYNSLALDAGPPIEKLAKTKLAAMEDPDLAKCWSFYDYVVRKEGLAGQQFLRSACANALKGSEFIAKWREESLAFFGMEGGDVLGEVDKRWELFAETEQDTGDTRRER